MREGPTVCTPCSAQGHTEGSWVKVSPCVKWCPDCRDPASLPPTAYRGTNPFSLFLHQNKQTGKSLGSFWYISSLSELTKQKEATRKWTVALGKNSPCVSVCTSLMTAFCLLLALPCQQALGRLELVFSNVMPLCILFFDPKVLV